MDLSDPKLTTLLRAAERARQEHELTARLTGEKFNVFNILGLSTAEVRTHSAFLAELLNPNGSHGQGGTYLDLFLKRLSIDASAFDADGARVSIETSIGSVNLQEGTGGRIDLLLTDATGHHIVIENKVYAGDQDSQLLRYHSAYPDAVLCYLTLNGDAPSDQSKGKEDFPVVRISYRENIVEWLDECHRAAVSLPVVRETVLQYKNLIRRLTHQSTGDKVKEEARRFVLANPDLADAIVLLGEAWNAILSEVESDFRKQVSSLTQRFALDSGVVVHRSVPADVDEGSVVVAFRADREKQGPLSDNERRAFASALQRAIPTARQNSAKKAFWNVGWFIPAPFGIGGRLAGLPKPTILSLHENRAELTRLADGVKQQAEEVTRRLLDELRTS